MIWRVYCNGVEFGTDYPTRESAQKVKRSYKSEWPMLNYYIRRVA